MWAKYYYKYLYIYFILQIKALCGVKGTKIDYTGIHVLNYLFSKELSLKWDQDEISGTTFWSLMKASLWSLWKTKMPGYLFSMKLSLKWDQDEISRAILKILPVRAPDAYVARAAALLRVNFSKLF